MVKQRRIRRRCNRAIIFPSNFAIAADLQEFEIPYSKVPLISRAIKYVSVLSVLKISKLKSTFIVRRSTGPSTICTFRLCRSRSHARNLFVLPRLWSTRSKMSKEKCYRSREYSLRTRKYRAYASIFPRGYPTARAKFHCSFFLEQRYIRRWT